VFESVLRRYMAEGLVRGEGFAIDASVIKADANGPRGFPAAEWSNPEAPSRAVREYLTGLDTANPADDDDAPLSEPPANSPPKNISTTDPAALRPEQRFIRDVQNAQVRPARGPLLTEELPFEPAEQPTCLTAPTAPQNCRRRM
jgi:hypothetical protein